MNTRERFYHAAAGELIPDRGASILICGGGSLDKQIFESLGFRDVTISNIDSRMKGDEYAPFQWRFENAEALALPPDSFDYVVCHAALHHASSPHRMLTEMYRVARKGILAIEARDSLLMRAVARAGFTQVYEHAAVYHNDCLHGGVNNTAVPNYVYRWTEREVEKTIRSFAPQQEPRITFRYGTGFPCTPEVERTGRLKYVLLKCLEPAYWLFARVFPRQQNLFAFFVAKGASGRLFPWLTTDEQGFDRVWGEDRYGAR